MNHCWLYSDSNSDVLARLRIIVPDRLKCLVTPDIMDNVNHQQYELFTPMGSLTPNEMSPRSWDSWHGKVKELSDELSAIQPDINMENHVLPRDHPLERSFDREAMNKKLDELFPNQSDFDDSGNVVHFIRSIHLSQTVPVLENQTLTPVLKKDHRQTYDECKYESLLIQMNRIKWERKQIEEKRKQLDLQDAVLALKQKEIGNMIGNADQIKKHIQIMHSPSKPSEPRNTKPFRLPARNERLSERSDSAVFLNKPIDSHKSGNAGKGAVGSRQLTVKINRSKDANSSLTENCKVAKREECTH